MRSYHSLVVHGLIEQHVLALNVPAQIVAGQQRAVSKACKVRGVQVMAHGKRIINTPTDLTQAAF